MPKAISDGFFRLAEMPKAIDGGSSAVGRLVLDRGRRPDAPGDKAHCSGKTNHSAKERPEDQPATVRRPTAVTRTTEA